MKCRVHTRYIVLTYSATIFAWYTTPDDDSIRPKHVVRKGWLDNKIHLWRKYVYSRYYLHLSAAETFRRIKLERYSDIQSTVSTCVLHAWHSECSCSKCAGTTDLCLYGSTFQCRQSLGILNGYTSRKDLQYAIASYSPSGSAITCSPTDLPCSSIMHVVIETVLINYGLRRPVSGKLDSNDINETSMAI
jgi:hypothetical protein